MRSIIFKTGLKFSKTPDLDFEAVKKVYLTADSVDARMAALSSLGSINSIELVHFLLKMALSDDIVKPQDIMRPVGSLTSNPNKAVVLDILWNWCIKNWDTLHERLSVSLSLLGRVLQTCISEQVGVEFVKVVEDWAKGADCPSAEAAEKRAEQLLSAKRPLEQGLEKVKGVTAWVNRDNTALLEWSVAQSSP